LTAELHVNKCTRQVYTREMNIEAHVGHGKSEPS
jgi:hypothetical protein